MEGKFTLLVVLVACATFVRASASLRVESSCDDEKHGALVPHPDDCGKFIQCVWGAPHVHKCPVGLHFDAKKKVCNFPDEAKCDIKRVAVKHNLAFGAADDDDDDLVEACKGEAFGALVGHPHICTKFLYCLATPVVRDCPAGLHFNPKLRVCDWPQNAGCAVTTTPSQTDPTPPETTETEPETTGTTPGTEETETTVGTTNDPEATVPTESYGKKGLNL